MSDFAIILNGTSRRLPDGTTVAGLLASLGLDRAHVAVERNHDVVLRARYDEVVLVDGDRIEVVAFVGGG